MVDSLGGAKMQYRYAAPGRYTGQPSLISQPQLCEECNKNQASKIQQLNSFEPSRESYFDSELDAHKHQLDEKYKLCRACHHIVKCHLNVQAMDLKTFLLDSHLQQSKSTPTKLLKRSSPPRSISVVLAQLACVFLASLLVCSDSLSSNHNTCDKAFSLWNTSHVVGHAFWSNFTREDISTVAKETIFQLTHSLRVIMSSSWDRGLDLMLCFCSLAKRRYLHVCLVCLLINILIFLKRKNRFGILIMFSWTMLSALRCWEVFWLKANCGWRVTGATFCWVLGTCSFLFSLLLYSRALGTTKKRSYRAQLTPSQSTTENHHVSDSEIVDTPNDSEPSHGKTAAELDHNLNGLSLGLPAERRRNGYSTHLSPRNSGTAGSFWNQRVESNAKETPLVSMQQRPLIVPATLHFSGLQERFTANQTRGATNVPRPVTNSYTISSDDDVSLSDAMDEENLMQNSRVQNDKGSKPEKAPRKIKRRNPSESSKTRITGFITVKTFLLLASLLLNAYFIVLLTEWPVRILHSLWKTFKRYLFN
ncbi:uncharacterized protein LOC144657481 [Oculina patagonica]